MLLETAFIIQHDRSQVQPCVFRKCYLHALFVLIHPTEFTKRLLWARCHADAGKGETLRSVNGKVQCRGQCHTWKVHRALGEHREGGTHSRWWVGMGQSGKTDWLGFETCAEVRGGQKWRSRLCTVRSVGRVEFKGVWTWSVGLWYGDWGEIEGCWRVFQEPLNSEYQTNHSWELTPNSH